MSTEADITQDFPAERLERVSEDLRITDSCIGVFVEQHCRARVEALVSIGGDVDALHDLVGHDAKRPRVAGIGDFDRGGACVEKRHLRLLHERHNCKRGVRALFAERDLRLVLLQEPLGCLRRGERTACRILVLNLEPVAVDSGLVDLLNRQLDALLVLYAKVRTRS